MAIAADWTINPSNKTIQHTSGSTVYTVNELYSYICSVFDDWDLIPETFPIRANTPTIYSWTNGWKMADEVSYQFLKTGAMLDTTNGDTYVNIQTIGSIQPGSNIYIYRSDGTEVTPWWGTDHIDILVKVKESNVLISSGTMTLFIREYGDQYDHFDLDASNRSINTVALSTSNDFSNNTDIGTIGAINDVTFTFAPIQRDLLNGAGLRSYDLEINCNNRPLQEVFEYTKYLTRRGSGTLLDGIAGERFLSVDPVSYEVNKKSPFGTFVGGKWYLTQGIWLKNYLIENEEGFELIDSTGVTQLPPLNLGLVLLGLQNGSIVTIFNQNDGSLITKFTNTGTSVNYRYTYTADIPIRIVIMHDLYRYQEILTTLSSSDSTIPINQIDDPLYLDAV